MASFGRTLMDVYYTESKNAQEAGDYNRSIVMNNAESLVNQFHHGLHPTEWLPRLISALESNSELDFMDEDEREAYCEAVEMAKKLAAENGFSL